MCPKLLWWQLYIPYLAVFIYPILKLWEIINTHTRPWTFNSSLELLCIIWKLEWIKTEVYPIVSTISKGSMVCKLLMIMHTLLFLTLYLIIAELLLHVPVDANIRIVEVRSVTMCSAHCVHHYNPSICAGN